MVGLQTDRLSVEAAEAGVSVDTIRRAYRSGALRASVQVVPAGS
jgi:hypothetical protein